MVPRSPPQAESNSKRELVGAAIDVGGAPSLLGLKSGIVPSTVPAAGRASRPARAPKLPFAVFRFKQPELVTQG